MNLQTLRDDMLAALTSTSGLTATEKQKARDRAVLLYPAEYAQFLAQFGLTNTAANRGAFFIYLTVNVFWKGIYTAGSHRENQATVPAPDTFEG